MYLRAVACFIVYYYSMLVRYYHSELGVYFVQINPKTAANMPNFVHLRL
jgi:hypothetical protein